MAATKSYLAALPPFSREFEGVPVSTGVRVQVLFASVAATEIDGTVVDLARLVRMPSMGERRWS